jgi:hypothetical protein
VLLVALPLLGKSSPYPVFPGVVFSSRLPLEAVTRLKEDEFGRRRGDNPTGSSAAGAAAAQ